MPRKVVRIAVGGDGLARSRFAISPLWELVHALRSLAGNPPRDRFAVLPWVRRHRERYQALRHQVDIDAVLALQPPGYGADFLSPPPVGIATSLDDQLATVRATPLVQARTEIDQALRLGPPVAPQTRSLLTDPTVTDRLADVLTRCWDELLATDWPQLRAILERDVIHRAGRLAAGGWQAALADVHPRLRWRDGRIELLRWPQPDGDLAGRGLVLMPSVFIGSGLALGLEPPWPPTLVYLARGAAALWSANSTSSSRHALDKLLGQSRASILTMLDEPASTTQLVSLLGLTLGSIGHHLAVLHAAGLVTKTRAGRSVLYHRTPVGDALTATATDEP